MTKMADSVKNVSVESTVASNRAHDAPLTCKNRYAKSSAQAQSRTVALLLGALVLCSAGKLSDPGVDLTWRSQHLYSFLEYLHRAVTSRQEPVRNSRSTVAGERTLFATKAVFRAHALQSG